MLELSAKKEAGTGVFDQQVENKAEHGSNVVPVTLLSHLSIIHIYGEGGREADNQHYPPHNQSFFAALMPTTVHSGPHKYP